MTIVLTSMMPLNRPTPVLPEDVMLKIVQQSSAEDLFNLRLVSQSFHGAVMSLTSIEPHLIQNAQKPAPRNSREAFGVLAKQHRIRSNYRSGAANYRIMSRAPSVPILCANGVFYPAKITGWPEYGSVSGLLRDHNGRIDTLDLAKAACSKDVSPCGRWLAFVAFHAPSSLFLSDLSDGATRPQMAQIEGAGRGNLKFSPCGAYIALVEQSALSMWRAQPKLECLVRIHMFVEKAAFSATGRFLAAVLRPTQPGRAHREVLMMDIPSQAGSTAAFAYTLLRTSIAACGVSHLAIAADGLTLSCSFAGDAPHEVHRRHSLAETGFTKLAVPRLFDAAGAEFSPCNGYLAVVSPKSLNFWHVAPSACSAVWQKTFAVAHEGARADLGEGQVHFSKEMQTVYIADSFGMQRLMHVFDFARART